MQFHIQILNEKLLAIGVVSKELPDVNKKSSFKEPNFFLKNANTGKSLSEGLIFATTNPQYDNRLFNT